MRRSSFNPDDQNRNAESKIVAALERISEAFRVLLWDVSKQVHLSPIQIQILVFLLFHSREKCKVNYLADEFNMTKATISDSVKVLLKKGLVGKETDNSDMRSYNLFLTSEGEKLAKRSASFAQNIEKSLYSFDNAQKEGFLANLLKLIEQLNENGVITIQRMCFSCKYFSQYKSSSFCNLLNKPLAPSELRIDCPEHEGILK